MSKDDRLEADNKLLMHVRTDLGMTGGDEIELVLHSISVSAETKPLMRGGFEWCGQRDWTMESYGCPWCTVDGRETEETLDCDECHGTGEREEICCEYHAWESTCDDFHTSQCMEPAMPEVQHANL